MITPSFWLRMHRIAFLLLSVVFPPDPIEELLPRALPNIPKAENPPFPWADALYRYRDPMMRRALQLMKKQKTPPVAYALANVLEKKLLEIIVEIPDASSLTIISMPLPRERFLERGFNQVDEVLERIMHPTITSRIQKNILQAAASARKQSTIKKRHERFVNRAGCFSIYPDASVLGKTFIIIDDILTSGATLDEARRVLLAHGASEVQALTIAH